MNTRERGTVSIVIVGKKGKYTGICREFGFVEEGDNPREIQRRIMNSCILLLKTVKTHPRLEPSLNVSPPFKYLLIYYLVIFSTFMAKVKYDFVSFSKENRINLSYA